MNRPIPEPSPSAEPAAEPPDSLVGILSKHRPRSAHFCSCGWQGDELAVHMFDVLLPLHFRLADAEAAVERVEAEIADWIEWAGADADDRSSTVRKFASDLRHAIGGAS